MTASGVLVMQTASVLRESIISGRLAPGAPLREAALSEQLGVSRNTLREAFRELVSQGLIEHRVYRGVIVKVLTQDEIHEMYTIRRTIELRAIEESAFATPDELDLLTDVTRQASAAAARGAWQEAGTQSLYFHCGIVALLGSRRLNDLFRTVCAQLRLAFSLATDEEDFQKPWVERDRELCELIRSGRRVEAGRAAEGYLRDSERAVLEVARVIDMEARHKLATRSSGSKSLDLDLAALGRKRRAVRSNGSLPVQEND